MSGAGHGPTAKELIAEGRRVLAIEAAAISALQDRLGDDFAEACHLVAVASGRVVCCGIGKSGCLCGAITGGVMALGLYWRADCSADLMSAFKEAFQTTCCRGLSKSYAWGREEHQANCRKITVATAGLVEELLFDPE